MVKISFFLINNPICISNLVDIIYYKLLIILITNLIN